MLKYVWKEKKESELFLDWNQPRKKAAILDKMFVSNQITFNNIVIFVYISTILYIENFRQCVRR